MKYEIWHMEDVPPDETFTRTHSASHRFLPNGAVQLRRSRPIARADARRLRLQSRPRQARLRRGDFQQGWYDLRSFSRPGQALTALGYPIARMLQNRFARESTRRMLKAVGEGQGG